MSGACMNPACPGASRYSVGRCNPCAAWWYAHDGEERPAYLISAYERRADEQARVLADPAHVALGRRLVDARVPEVVASRFVAKVRFDESGCWVWAGALGNGYPELNLYRQPTRAHRLIYEWLVGPIPAGMHIDHLCRRPVCVNPEHLEAVTPFENWRRGESPGAIAQKRDICRRGHSLAGDNAYVRKDTGARLCRECRRIRDRARVG